MAHQPLDSSLAPVAGDNMSGFRSFGPVREYTIPLPEDPSPGHDAWKNQVAFQQRHVFPPEHMISAWHGPHLNNQSDAYGTNVSGARAMQHTFPGDGNSPGSIGQYSPYGEPSSYGGSNTSYSSSGSIDPRLTQEGILGSPSQYPQEIGLSCMSLVASPGQLTTAASSPASLHYQYASPAQATGYTTDSAGSYFYPNPNCLQPSARQMQHPASSPQGWELYLHQKVDNFALSPRLPYRPTHHEENQDIEEDDPNPRPHSCGCGATYGCLTDLERHRNTSKKHDRAPRGPACPVDPCSYPSRFTSVDNFKAHYMKQHEMSSDEADAFIREWKDQGMYKEPW